MCTCVCLFVVFSVFMFVSVCSSVCVNKNINSDENLKVVARSLNCARYHELNNRWDCKIRETSLLGYGCLFQFWIIYLKEKIVFQLNPNYIQPQRLIWTAKPASRNVDEQKLLRRLQSTIITSPLYIGIFKRHFINWYARSTTSWYKLQIICFENSWHMRRQLLALTRMLVYVFSIIYKPLNHYSD